MYKVLALFGVAFAVLTVFVIKTQKSGDRLTPLLFMGTPSPSVKPSNGITLDYQGTNLRVQSFTVGDLAKLELNPNFKDKISAHELVTSKGCKNLVNGGFYSKSDTPLGLLISNGLTEGDYRTNGLFNAIFGVTFADKAFLGSTYPRGSTRLAIQSGPLLIKDGQEQTLQMKNDEEARRNVVALTQDGKVVFLSVYYEGREFNGPLLVDLPKVVALAGQKLNLNLASALNLDGGSASAFYTPEVSLQEISYIGSYFCEKQ